jgi:hypothetical protein
LKQPLLKSSNSATRSRLRPNIDDAAGYHRRHHLPVTSKMTAYASGSPDAALIRPAQEMNADLTVACRYGRSRLGE